MSESDPEAVLLMARLADALGHAFRPSTVPEALQRSVREARSLFSAAACSCALVGPGGTDLRFVAADGVGADEIIGIVLPVGGGLAGWAVMSGQPIAVADVGEDPRFARDVATRTRYVPSRILAAPLVDEGGSVLGVLEVLDPATVIGDDSSQSLGILGALASAAATIVRLCGFYDNLGAALLESMVGAEDAAQYSDRLGGSIRDGMDIGMDLTGVAVAFHDLAATGSDGAVLAERLLGEVARFVNSRR